MYLYIGHADQGSLMPPTLACPLKLKSSLLIILGKNPQASSSLCGSPLCYHEALCSLSLWLHLSPGTVVIKSYLPPVPSYKLQKKNG